MSIVKSLLILATAGTLAACDGTLTGGTGDGMGPVGGPRGGTGGVDESLIRDAGLMGKLEGASMVGGTVSYAYFTDVVSDGRVLSGADVYCGGPGRAVINLQRGDRGGRAFNTMAFTCR